jgi:hypothetical protein
MSGRTKHELGDSDLGLEDDRLRLPFMPECYGQTTLCLT